MADDIPQWAWDRVDKELVPFEGVRTTQQWAEYSDRLRTALATMIAAHEKAPVDRLLLEAREIVASWWDRNPARFPGTPSHAYRDGSRDNAAEIEQALAALRRGIELGGQR